MKDINYAAHKINISIYYMRETLLFHNYLVNICIELPRLIFLFYFLNIRSEYRTVSIKYKKFTFFIRH